MEFWIDNPKILFNANHIHEIWIYKNMTTNQKLNAMTRLIILLSLLGFICLNRSIFLIIGLILVALIVIVYKKEDLMEGLTNNQTQPILPTNPVNNVLMTDYKDHPKLKPNHPEYSVEVENSINTSALSSIFLQNSENKDIQNGFGTTRDQFEFEQSMRPFVTQSVNTVDQVEYGDFLKFFAGSMPSGKPLQIH
jgi:hypothetical protein